MDKRNGSIDAFRFVAACLVVLCHSLYAEYRPTLFVLNLIGRWIIPFFFLVSGYFFQKGYAARPNQSLLKTLSGLLSATLFVNLFYFLFTCLTEDSIRPLRSFFTLLTGTYFHLWFLTSLVIGYVVLWCFLKFRLIAWLPYLVAVSFIVILLFYPYNFLIHKGAHPIQARSLLSIPFLTMGFLIARHTLEARMSRKIAYVLIAVGSVIQLGESWLLTNAGVDSLKVNYLAGTLPLSIGIFMLSFSLSISPDSWVSRYGRLYSFPIYLYHPVVLVLLNRNFEKIAGTTGILYWSSPLLALGIIVLLFVWLDRVAPTVNRVLCGDFTVYTSSRKPAKASLSTRVK